MRAKASLQLAAGRDCEAGDGVCWLAPLVELGVGLEGQRNPELGRSLLTEGLDCSLERVAYAPLGDSSRSEGDAGGGRSRRCLRGDVGDRDGAGV